jgi:SsrA-binding protein
MREAECSTRADRRIVGIGVGVFRSVRIASPAWDNGAMAKNSSNKTGKDKGKAAAGGPVVKTIALNKRSRHEYHLEERFEAGLALQGWELKAIRAGRANIVDAYAMIREGEMFLYGSQITPLITASSHVVAEDRRTRKLLLHRREIDRLIGRVQREGYTVVLTALYWKGNKVKAEIALAKGKQAHDKREASKERDWAREKQRVMRRHNKNA